MKVVAAVVSTAAKNQRRKTEEEEEEKQMKRREREREEVSGKAFLFPLFSSADFYRLSFSLSFSLSRPFNGEIYF